MDSRQDETESNRLQHSRYERLIFQLPSRQSASERTPSLAIKADPIMLRGLTVVVASLVVALSSHSASCFQFVPKASAAFSNHAVQQRHRLSFTTTTTTTSSGRGSSLFMMMEAPEVVECDVCIVGGGPAGCTCALYTSRADLKTVVLDKNPAVGALAITSHIANYPGVDKAMTGPELLEQMRVQAIDYGTDYRRAQVFMIEVDLDNNEDGQQYTKTVYTPDAQIKARSLVLASGAMGRYVYRLLAG